MRRDIASVAVIGGVLRELVGERSHEVSILILIICSDHKADARHL
jgi:hypothetical protein